MKNYYLFILVIFNFLSCKDTFEYNNPIKENYSQNDYITDFVHNTCYNYYLWNQNIPKIFDPKKWNSPKEYFESIRYSQDNISKILDDYQKVNNAFDNIEVSDGIKYSLFYSDNQKSKINALVTLVYNNTPGQKAGIMRGDIITKINNQELTIDNYNSLLSEKQYTLTYQKISESENPQEYISPIITKEEITIDPVVISKIFEIDNKKIGYIMYDSFTSNAQQIKNALEEFSKENISKIIFDLRYNSGGYSSTLLEIASMVAGKENEGKIFLTNTYNKFLTESMQKEYGEDCLNERFVKEDFYLNIDEIFYLVSGNTASASEELIAGLMPYKKSTIIGSKTFGKYTSCSLFQFDKQGLGLENWCIYLIIGSCKNSLGEMNFKGGFVPNYEIKESCHYPIGDSEELLLNQALSLISPSIAKKSCKQNNNMIEEFIETEHSKDLINDLIKMPMQTE